MKRMRWIALPLGLALAGYAAVSAAANIYAEKAPALVLSILPNNGDALMRAVEVQIGLNGLDKKPDPKWRSQARTAILQRPLNPAALRTLGLVAEGAGDRDRARSIMNLSEDLSRRDLLAEMWLSLDAARRNDARAALGHIDTLLSTKQSAGPLVYPALSQVLGDPKFRREVMPMIRRDRPWLRSFLSFAQDNPVDPTALAETIIAAGGLPPDPDYRQYETDILWMLASAERYETAARYLVALKRTDNRTLANGQFTDVTLAANLGPFAWTPSLDPDVSSVIVDDSEIDARVAPNRSGTVLQRLLRLTPGTYTVRARTHLTTDEATPVLSVEALCAGNGETRTLMQKRLRVPSGEGRIGGSFKIPSDCPVQRIVFAARGDDLQLDSEFTLHDIGLARASAAPGQSGSRASDQ